MEDENAQIIVNEDGAFIPRALFGREDIIINELREGGVLSPLNGETSKKAFFKGRDAGSDGRIPMDR